jgi:hypothetical protein
MIRLLAAVVLAAGLVAVLLSACGGARACPRSAAADSAEVGDKSAEQDCRRARR